MILLVFTVTVVCDCASAVNFLFNVFCSLLDPVLGAEDSVCVFPLAASAVAAKAAGSAIMLHFLCCL